jgi:hypothetical protein
MTIPITISRKVQTPFKLQALRAFPREFIGFLLGRRAEDRLEVLDMFFPADQKEYATEGEGHHGWPLVDAGHGVCGPTEDDRAGEAPTGTPTGPGATRRAALLELGVRERLASNTAGITDSNRRVRTRTHGGVAGVGG